MYFGWMKKKVLTIHEEQRTFSNNVQLPEIRQISRKSSDRSGGFATGITYI